MREPQPPAVAVADVVVLGGGAVAPVDVQEEDVVQVGIADRAGQRGDAAFVTTGVRVRSGNLEPVLMMLVSVVSTTSLPSREVVDAPGC